MTKRLIDICLGIIALAAHWGLATWMIYDWHYRFGDFGGFPWFIIIFCFICGIVLFAMNLFHKENI